MTDHTPSVTTNLIELALISLSQRNDPLIIRVNAGSGLTQSEAVSVFTDLFTLSQIMQESGAIIADLDRQIADLESEAVTMKALLGLSDAEETRNPEK